MPNDSIEMKIKYFKRWNATLNSNAGGWEYFAFRTPIDAIFDEGSTDYKLLSAAEKTYIGNLIAQGTANKLLTPAEKTFVGDLNTQGTLTDWDNSAENTYYKGQLVVDSSTGKIYVCTATTTVPIAQTIASTSQLTQLTINETAIDSKITAASNTLTSAINTKVTASDLYSDTTTQKIKLSHFPDTILGQLTYGGIVKKYAPDAQGGTVEYYIEITYSQAAKDILDTKTGSTTPSTKGLSSISNIGNHEGLYFLVATGTNANVSSDADGYYINSFDYSGIHYEVGDWLIAVNGTWEKIDNTDAVTGVNGRIGNVYIYRGEFNDGTEPGTGVEDVRTALANFPAINKGDIWYGSFTDKMYINTMDLADIISSNDFTYLYELLVWVGGGTDNAETAAEGLGAIKAIGSAPMADSSTPGVVKLYHNLGGNHTDGPADQKVVADAINERVVYVSTTTNGTTTTSPAFPSTKYTGLIALEDN